jgi:hypothetical protein
MVPENNNKKQSLNTIRYLLLTVLCTVKLTKPIKLNRNIKQVIKKKNTIDFSFIYVN